MKNLDFSKKSITSVTKPHTPHNTSQYLTYNYGQSRDEKAGISEFQPYIEVDESPVDYLNSADDYCVTGGSMRGIYFIILIFRYC